MAAEQISNPIQRRIASIVTDSINVEERTVDVVWTTGAEVRRYDWAQGRVFFEELEVSDVAVRLERLNDGASVLDSHQSGSIRDIIGITKRAWIDEDKGRATLLIDDGDDEAMNIWRKIVAGIIRHISVGYAIHKAVEILEGDKHILRAIDWEPQEISFVPVGADAGAGVRSKNQVTIPCNFVRADDGTSPEGETMADQVEEKDEATPASSAPDDATRSQGSGQTSAENEPAAPADPTPPAAERGAATDEAEIIQICQLAKADLRTANDFIQRGVSPAQVRSELLDTQASRSEGDISGQHQTDSGQRAQQIDHGTIYRNFNGQG